MPFFAVSENYPELKAVESFRKRAFVEEDHAVLCDKQHKKRETE